MSSGNVLALRIFFAIVRLSLLPRRGLYGGLSLSSWNSGGVKYSLLLPLHVLSPISDDWYDPADGLRHDEVERLSEGDVVRVIRLDER